MRPIAAIVAVLILVGVAKAAHADDVNGRWTGDVELRGSYFLERSTRVEIPTARASLVSPTGLRVGADVLLDSITSASIAQGAAADSLFTERRWAFGLNVGRSHEVTNDATLDWNLFGRYSTENDYFASAVGMDTLLSMAQHCSMLRFNGSLIFDDVKKITDPTFDKKLRGMALRLSYEQVLTPTLVATVAWDVAYLDGFLANVYRTIAVPGEGRLSENHPNERFRHAPSLQIRFHIPASRTSLHFRVRGYTDSWDIHAMTAETRVYQELGENFVTRLRFRYYDQTETFFADNLYGKGTADHLVTADPKTQAFGTRELGLKTEWRLPWLAAISLDRAWFDASFDYRWNGNRFRNAVLAQVGMRVPF